MNRFRYTAKSIALIVGGEIHGRGDVDPEIRDLLIDSRRLIHPDGSMFIALESERNDGHRYIPELVERGVSCFLVNATYDVQGSRNVITRNEVTKQVKVQFSEFFQQLFTPTLKGELLKIMFFISLPGSFSFGQPKTREC